MIFLMRVWSVQQCLLGLFCLTTGRFDCVCLHHAAGNILWSKQICNRQLTDISCYGKKQKNKDLVIWRMKVEELTSFPQELKSIHVAVVADLSQSLSREKVEIIGLTSQRTVF